MGIWVGATMAVLWGLAVLFFRLNRIWLIYYIVGSVGMAFLIIFVGRATGIEPGLQTLVAAGVHVVSSLFDLPTQIFRAAPGAILVLVVDQDVGWTMLQVTVESSGLLETGVISGMLLFYPGWTIRRRLAYTVGAITFTYIANIVRLMVIVMTLHAAGKNSLLISHTIVGRAVFFALVILIYWYLMTRPTLRTVRDKIEKELVAP